jgi:hypothetical protein
LAANNAKKLYSGSCKMHYEYSGSDSSTKLSEYYKKLAEKQARWNTGSNAVVGQGNQGSGNFRSSGNTGSQGDSAGPVCGLIDNRVKTYISKNALNTAGAIFIYKGECLGECSNTVEPTCVKIGVGDAAIKRTFQTECALKD